MCDFDEFDYDDFDEDYGDECGWEDGFYPDYQGYDDDDYEAPEDLE